MAIKIPRSATNIFTDDGTTYKEQFHGATDYAADATWTHPCGTKLFVEAPKFVLKNYSKAEIRDWLKLAILDEIQTLEYYRCEMDNWLNIE